MCLSMEKEIQTNTSKILSKNYLGKKELLFLQVWDQVIWVIGIIEYALVDF